MLNCKTPDGVHEGTCCHLIPGKARQAAVAPSLRWRRGSVGGYDDGGQMAERPIRAAKPFCLIKRGPRDHLGLFLMFQTVSNWGNVGRRNAFLHYLGGISALRDTIAAGPSTQQKPEMRNGPLVLAG